MIVKTDALQIEGYCPLIHVEKAWMGILNNRKK